MNISPLDNQDGMHRTRITGEMKNNEHNKELVDQAHARDEIKQEREEKKEKIAETEGMDTLNPDGSSQNQQKQQKKKKKEEQPPISFGGGSFLDTEA